MADVDHYHYELPKHLIAQQPLAARADARLLVVDRARQALSHQHVRNLPDLLSPGDCLVLNDTRVVPARLVGFRQRTGGRWLGLFLECEEHGVWRVLCKARGKLTEGELITLTDTQGQDAVPLEMVARRPDGSWLVRPKSDEPMLALLNRVGRVPLPPYIRKGEMFAADRENYQTVFARHPGAVAAPTAGLHFTQALLERLKTAEIDLAWVTLHVGAGTFRPISVDRLEEHAMHAEWGRITPETVAQLDACRRRGGRIVAVGTTSMRLLETAAADGQLRPFCGLTQLFIRPPYQFRIVDALMTNFHLPRTTLLVLVRTFGGDELLARAYAAAITEEYRFFSYGDAMLIV